MLTKAEIEEHRTNPRNQALESRNYILRCNWVQFQVSSHGQC